METERILLKGQLKETEFKLNNLKLDIEGAKTLIRMSLPAYEDILKLKVKEAAAAMKLLEDKYEQYLELFQKSQAIRGELYD